MERKALSASARSADAASSINTARQGFKSAKRLQFAFHYKPGHEGEKGYKLIPSPEIWVQASPPGRREASVIEQRKNSVNQRHAFHATLPAMPRRAAHGTEPAVHTVAPLYKA